MQQQNTTDKIKTVNRVTLVSLTANSLLSALKIFFALIGGSTALLADGIHSISDVGTTIVAFAGIRLSYKRSDDSHPYGHEKIEPAMTKIVAVVLFVTAAFIVYRGYEGLSAEDVRAPGKIALWGACISIIVKEGLFHYTLRGARKIESGALRADAWHNRTDSLSSVASFVGILGGRWGYAVLDPLMAVGIGFYIMKVAISIYYTSLRGLIDTAADGTTVARIRDTAASVPGVERIDLLKTRLHGNRMFVDIEISVDGEMSLKKSHAISEEVHGLLEERYPRIKHCMVHVNPVEE
ncbi:MAG: cation diffusion facilitator family transporter [Fibrobacterota bacterium]